MKIDTHVPLAPLTTFRVGGEALELCAIKYLTDLEEVAKYLKNNKMSDGTAKPFFVLAGGSNTLAADAGFAGVVLKIELLGTKMTEAKGQPSGYEMVELVAAAGETWDDIVALSVKHGLYGLENLSAIPGSVGAAPVQNIGAYGVEVKELISFVEVFDLKAGKLVTMTPDECEFSYRDSMFKRTENHSLVITKVGFKLAKRGRVNIGYKDLKERFKDRFSKDITLSELRDAVIDIRAKKLPDWHILGTAGSFFKNPIISNEHFKLLQEKWPEMPGFAEVGEQGKKDDRVKVPLAWILDKVCGLKGWKNDKGTVGLYENQPLAIVNFGGATADEVRACAELVAKQVKEKTDIVIEWEVQLLA